MHLLLAVAFLLLIQYEVLFTMSIDVLDPIVATNNGPIRGRTLLSASNNVYFAFQGIPYAKPPLNELRFEPPVQIRNWTDILNATKDGPHCPQVIPEGLNIEISEDCLHLNVYTRPSLISQLRSVIIYIHGGGFYEGSNSFEHDVGVQYIMDSNVIFVAINYRLNIFGFISTGTKHAPGNVGLKDQIHALKWIKENIRYFGGNPNAITVMGESAGAMSVSLLLASPHSKGLFHRAILLSGSAIAQWKLPRDLLNITRKSAKMVGCRTDDIELMIICLKTVDFKVLAKTYKNLNEWHTCPLKNWIPVVEQYFMQERVLVEDPVLTYRRGDMAKVDLMIGVTKDEWAYTPVEIIQNETLLYEFDKKFQWIAPICLSYESNTNRSIKISQTLRNRTFVNNEINGESFHEIHTLFSEGVINYGVYRTIQLFSLQTDLNVYVYKFSYVGRYSHLYYPNPNISFGAVHADDLFYLFVQKDKAPPYNNTDPEWEFVQKYTRMIVNFAKFGNPAPDEDTLLENVTWHPYTLISPRYLEIDKIMEMKDNIPWERIQLWDQLFPYKDNIETSEKKSKTWLLTVALGAGFIVFALLLIQMVRHFHKSRSNSTE